MSNSYRLSNAELEEVRDIFRLFDTDNSGRVSVGVLLDTLTSLSAETSPSIRGNSNTLTLMSKLKQLSIKASLSLDEFTNLLMRPDSQDKRSELEKAFSLFDIDNKGYIDAADLKKIASDLGENVEENEISDMVMRTSSTGRVGFDDFKVIMTKRLFT